ncbi:MAG: GumC family protein [Acidimicrobiia bacterium]
MTAASATALHPEALEPSTVGLEPWSAREVARTYWRVPVLALLVGLLAYVGSFVVPPTYTASTRILIRGRDTTVLNSNGESLANQPGVVDSQLAATLADTQAGLLANRAIAERIVDELDLDVREEKSGPIATLQKAFAATYKRTRAVLTHGFYKEIDDRTAAVDAVQAGLGAKQVNDGFVLDVVALYDDPAKVAAIANLAADLLVDSTNERFRAESAAYRDFLAVRVDEANVAEQAARKALSDYKAANGIVTTPEEDALLLRQSEADLTVEIRQTQAELSAAQARVVSLRRDLASTSPLATTSQNIETGRSETDIETQSESAAYTALLGQLQTAQADVASLSAQLGALEGAFELATGDPTTLSSEEAELARLQLDVVITSDTRAQLSYELQTAAVNAERSVVEISRIDDAAEPTYPIAPKRYLFLAAGVLMGALAGFVWSFLLLQRGLRRRGEDEVIDLSTAAPVEGVTSGVSGPNGLAAPVAPAGVPPDLST